MNRIINQRGGSYKYMLAVATAQANSQVSVCEATNTAYCQACDAIICPVISNISLKTLYIRSKEI